MEITGTIKQVNNIDGTVAATRQTIGSTNYSPIRWVDGEEVAPLIEPVVREVIEEVGIDSTAVRNQSTVSGTTVTDALNTLKNSTPDNLLTDDILNSSDVDGETATYALNQLNTDISTLSSTVGEHTTEIAGLDGDLQDLTGVVSTLSSTVGEHTTEIAGLDGDLQDLTGVVNGNTASINQLNQQLTKVISKRIDISNIPVNTAWGSNYISSSQVVDISDLPIQDAKSVQVTWVGSVTSLFTIEELSRSALRFILLRGTPWESVNGKIYINCYVD